MTRPGVRYGYEEVKKIFTERGYELLETEYKNNVTKMKFICPEHPDVESEITLASLIRGSKCNICSKNKKVDFSQVKKDFEAVGLILLETEYRNTGQKMKCKCPKHHDVVQEKYYGNVRHKKTGCSLCENERKSSVKRFSFEEVKRIFGELNYTLLETDYKNAQQKLKYRCNYHPEYVSYIKLNALRNGTRCVHCVRVFSTFEAIKEEFDKRGYELLETEYKPSSYKLKYRCPKHPQFTSSITRGNLKLGKGCPHCGHDIHRGENHHQWRGGVSELNQHLRARLRQWIGKYKPTKESRCFVTGDSINLQIHHSTPFHVVRNKVLGELNLPFLNKVAKYKEEELNAIVERLREYHEDIIGVPLREDIHKLFHHIYGYDVTPYDLSEFKARYLAGEFDDKEKTDTQIELLL